MSGEGREVDILFDGPPGPESGRFVEVESPPGTGIGDFGEWVRRDDAGDGWWALRVCDRCAPLEQRIAELERERDEAMERAARVCDDFSDAHRGDRKTVGQVYSPIAEALDRCAAAIRARGASK